MELFDLGVLLVLDVKLSWTFLAETPIWEVEALVEALRTSKNKACFEAVCQHASIQINPLRSEAAAG